MPLCTALFSVQSKDKNSPMQNNHPIIGVTISRRNLDNIHHLALPGAYVEALEKAGGDTILIPPRISQEGLIKLLSFVNGILFSGGGDVHPERYGGSMHHLVSDINPDRDQLEIDLVEAALRKKLPLLGICRGLQVINIALGGTIYEDLASQKSGALNHRTVDELPRHYLAHSVEIGQNSHLSKILNKRDCLVNSHHHQGIRELAPGLAPTAFAPDGLIEAFEKPDHPFFIAVQWHPECMSLQDGMGALFSAFIQSMGN